MVFTLNTQIAVRYFHSLDTAVTFQIHSLNLSSVCLLFSFELFRRLALVSAFWHTRLKTFAHRHTDTNVLPASRLPERFSRQFENDIAARARLFGDV